MDKYGTVGVGNANPWSMLLNEINIPRLIRRRKIPFLSYVRKHSSKCSRSLAQNALTREIWKTCSTREKFAHFAVVFILFIIIRTVRRRHQLCGIKQVKQLPLFPSLSLSLSRSPSHFVATNVSFRGDRARTNEKKKRERANMKEHGSRIVRAKWICCRRAWLIEIFVYEMFQCRSFMSAPQTKQLWLKNQIKSV